jgi:hypothetical protein
MIAPRIAAAALLCGVILGASWAPGLASEPPKTKPTLTAHEPTTTRVKGQLILRANLATADGKPLTDRPVRFYQQVEFFGQREAYLGSTKTDSTGLATLFYQPVQTGPQTIVAHVPGDAGYGSVASSVTVQVRDAAPAFHAEPLPLARVRQWLPLALLGVVLATWAVLLAVFLRAVLGIRRTARRPSRSAPTVTPPSVVAPAGHPTTGR